MEEILDNLRPVSELAISHNTGITLNDNSSSWRINYTEFLVLLKFFEGNFLVLLPVERKL